MDYPYKLEIAKLVEDARWNGHFQSPSSRIREYRLEFPGEYHCLADFCYEIRPTGKLFIEDDDAPRALNNMVKYWRWCVNNPKQQPIHLLHIIGSDTGVWVEHCRFLQSRTEKELNGNSFHYHMVTINKEWHNPGKWLSKIQDILKHIAGR